LATYRFRIDLFERPFKYEFLPGSSQLRYSWHLPKFAISHGAGQEPAIIPSKQTSMAPIKAASAGPYHLEFSPKDGNLSSKARPMTTLI
jgi:hypothetical protein